MFYAIIVFLALLEVVEAIAFANVMKSQLRQSARERDVLVNQICNLAGKPWQEPPALTAYPPDNEKEEMDADRYVTSFADYLEADE